METFRRYGNPPYRVIVVHGGPGAVGEMAPVARELSQIYGVLEPLQTATSLDGQIHELQDVLRTQGNPSVTLIGHSYGALLGFLFTAQNPHLVKKLILVGSGVFDEAYAPQVTATRMSRLAADERAALYALVARLNDPGTPDKDTLFMQYGEMFSRTDMFDPLPYADENVWYQYAAFERAWRGMERLRRSGKLLASGGQISCPVVAIHGDYDPHPAEGIRLPLSRVVKDFRFILLDRCGHYPWRERHAREYFYAALTRELAGP